MSDKNTSIQEIRDWVRQWREKRGWTRRQNAKNYAILYYRLKNEKRDH